MGLIVGKLSPPLHRALEGLEPDDVLDILIQTSFPLEDDQREALSALGLKFKKSRSTLRTPISVETLRSLQTLECVLSMHGPITPSP